MSALQNSKIVPDVIDGIDTADEQVELVVKYPKQPVTNGNLIPKEDAQEEPVVEIVGAKGLHTLVMSDPDAPSPTAPKFREFLHWLIINIPDGDISKGKVVVPYMGPAPPEGKHRYIFTLWRQTPSGDMSQIAKEDVDHPIEVSPPGDRKNFSTRKFAQDHRLRGPVAVRFYYSEP